mgnify:CR=1 FL=1
MEFFQKFVPGTALFLVVLFAFPRVHYAQTLDVEPDFINRYAAPGSSTIQVYIWGSVGTTGIWRIEPDLDLVELLSAAQVTGIGQEVPGSYQRVRLRIYRTVEGNRRMIYEEQLDNVLAAGAGYPSLQGGDVLEVETQRRRSFTERVRVATGLIGSAASLILLYLRISRGR